MIKHILNAHVCCSMYVQTFTIAKYLLSNTLHINFTSQYYEFPRQCWNAAQIATES